MKTITNTMKKGIIISAFIFILFNTNAFPWLFANGSETGYPVFNPNLIGVGNISIEMLIKEGAGYFLNASSDIQSLLNRYEWQNTVDISYIELNKMLKNALTNITLAKSNYEELIRVAEVTPYNLDVIYKLKYFDYDSFIKESKLNPFIFNVVKNFLLKGDITGTFKYTIERFKNIEMLILRMQDEMNANRLPEVSMFWRLNELCAETSLFGSYIARVFKAIQ